jgi:hypothetical protein
VLAILAAAEAAGHEPALSADSSFVSFVCPVCGTGRALIDEHTASCTNGCAPDTITGLLTVRARACARASEPEAELAAPNGSTPLGEVSVVTLAEFIAVEEAGAEPLVGDGDAVLIPSGGIVPVYGDGGAGKTTLTIDLGCHLAAGDDWLGIAVQRQSRVLIVENEGPRALFRAKLRRKDAGWSGSPLGDRISVLEEPWTKFSFAEYDARQALADAIREREIDVVVIGPVTAAGMTAAGTIQEVREFTALVELVGALSRRRVTFILIHHESKSGQVSGAWEGVGDTLFHVTGLGHGKTLLYIQKARWSSKHHGMPLRLAWAEGDSFKVEEAATESDDDLRERIVAAVAAEPGLNATALVKATPDVDKDRRQKERDMLLELGVLVNVGRDESGSDVLLDCVPPKKRARLYLASHPTISHLRLASAADAPQIAALREEEGNLRLRRAALGSIEPHAADADFSPPVDPPTGSQLVDQLRARFDAQEIAFLEGVAASGDGYYDEPDGGPPSMPRPGAVP